MSRDNEKYLTHYNNGQYVLSYPITILKFCNLSDSLHCSTSVRWPGICSARLDSSIQVFSMWPLWLLFPHSISSTQSISNVLALKCTVPLQRANQLYSILFCLVEDTEPAVCGVLTGPGSPLCLLPFGWLPPPARGWHLVDPHRSPWPSQSTDMIKTWFSFQCKQRTASSNQRLYIKEANACILWFGQQDLWKCHWSH